MGAEISRKQNMPDNIDSFESKIKKSWNKESITSDVNNSNQYKLIPPRDEMITKCGNEIVQTFQELNLGRKESVLEIMSGNCIVSKLLYDKLEPIIDPNGDYICSDVVSYSPAEYLDIYPFEFVKMNSVQAVEKYGKNSTLLMLVAPPPCPSCIGINGEYAETIGYGDYFACRNYIQQTKEMDNVTKFIIFYGELGASDGSSGMYKYMMEHESLDLIKRIVVFDEFGVVDRVVKELFIFKIQ